MEEITETKREQEKEKGRKGVQRMQEGYDSMEDETTDDEALEEYLAQWRDEKYPYSEDDSDEDMNDNGQDGTELENAGDLKSKRVF